MMETNLQAYEDSITTQDIREVLKAAKERNDAIQRHTAATDT